jgi:hypothetical protein
MLNQTGIKTTTGATRKTILFDTKLFFALPCKVSGTKDETILAGTPLKGSLSARDTEFTVAGSSDTPVGILEHDVVLDSNGKANAAVLTFGFIDESKLDSTVTAMLTDEVKAKLPQIQFCK